MPDETIRYASREKDTSAHNIVCIWDALPSDKYDHDKVYWMGSISSLVHTCTVTEFIKLFGYETLPKNGECLPVKIELK